MPYYRGSSSYPHPEKPGYSLLYIRNRPGWRVSVRTEDAPKLHPFDLFQDKAGSVWCKNVLGKQVLLCSIVEPWELYRHVQVLP